MIIRRHSTGTGRTDRDNRTILTAALPPSNNTATTAQRQISPALGDPVPGASRRRELRDRVEIEAAIATLAADGSRLLDDMEGDDHNDAFDLADRFERDFDEMAGATFAPITDPARKATAFRKLALVRARLMAAAQVMQEETEDRSFAGTVFNAAETVLSRARKDPEGTADQLERVAGIIEMTDLSPERKDQVGAAVAARAITAGLEGLLGPRIKKHVPAGRQFLAGLRTADTADDGATTADASRGDKPNSGEVIAQINASPLASPSSVPDGSGSEGAPVETDSVVEPDADEDPIYVQRISGLIRDTISPVEPNIIGRLQEGIQPGRIRHTDLLIELVNFFQFTLEDDETRVRDLARKADLEEDIAALFHDFFKVTPDTLPLMRARVAKITDDGNRGPLLQQLRIIANSGPEDRQSEVDSAVSSIARFYVLALPLSKAGRARARQELLNARFVIDFNELELD